MKSQKKERINRSPLEKMTYSISTICSILFDDYFYQDIPLLRSYGISNNSNVINEIIENNFSEQQIENLNPTALVGGYLILKNKQIDKKKVDFIFKKEVNGIPIIKFFKERNVREEDIIRYARLWIKLFHLH